MDILSITFSEIKHFALDSTGAGMAVIDKWFVGLVLLIAILPILTFTGVTKSKITDFTPVERIAQKSATLMIIQLCLWIKTTLPQRSVTVLLQLRKVKL